MAQHDNYDKDILKALKSIASRLEGIEKCLNSMSIITRKENCNICKFTDLDSCEEPCFSCVPITSRETGIRHMTNFQNKEEKQ